MPGGSTRSVLDVRPFPFRITRAHGCRIVDVDDHEYVDFLGDYSAGMFGHDPSPIAAAVNAALGRGWSYGGQHSDEVRFAEAVCTRFAGIEQVRFTNSGTEANLLALQLARHHTGRDRIVVADGAYHGSLLSFGGHEAMIAPFACDRITYNDSGSLDVIDQGTAAVLLEPMMGAAGCIPAEPGFLRAVRAACDRTGALLVLDEVMTSRMSIGGAQQRFAVEADLTTLGKYIAGGMSVGAFGGRADVMAAFDPAQGGALSHGGTFNNNVVTMAAGVAAAEVLTASVLDDLYQRGESLRARTDAVLAASGRPMCVTGMGSLMSFHGVAGPVTAPYPPPREPLVELLWHEFLARGIYIAPRGYVALSIAIGDDECDAFVDTLGVAMDAFGPPAH
ncbi:glutamate-1-semialdehyde 2,1-aminomutase [soil metagenome]